MTFKTFLSVLGVALFTTTQVTPAAAEDDNSGTNKKTIIVQSIIPGAMSSGNTGSTC